MYMDNGKIEYIYDKKQFYLFSIRVIRGPPGRGGSGVLGAGQIYSDSKGITLRLIYYENEFGSTATRDTFC